MKYLFFSELFQFRIFLASPVFSVQFSHSAMSVSLRPHESQHARPPCPSPAPGVYSNSCPLSRWCYPTASSSTVPFSFCLQSSQHQGLFKWVNSLHQVAKVLDIQLWHQSFQWIFRTDFLFNGLVGSPCSPRDSQESSPTPQFKSINSSALSFLYGPTLSLSLHFCFVGKVMSLLFNMLSRLIIAFLPKNKCLLISWLQLPSAVILEPKKIKSVTVSIVPHLFAMKWWHWMPWSSSHVNWWSHYGRWYGDSFKN